MVKETKNSNDNKSSIKRRHTKGASNCLRLVISPSDLQSTTKPQLQVIEHVRTGNKEEQLLTKQWHCRVGESRIQKSEFIQSISSQPVSLRLNTLSHNVREFH